MKLEILLSGLIGAVIAVFVAFLIKRITEARNQNKIKKSIIAYLEIIAIDKLNRYISDSQHTKKRLLSVEFNESEPEYCYDYMPMLTSDYFKSIGNKVLFDVIKKQDDFILMLDLYYTIDFLKENMPIEYHKKFILKIENHFEIKGIVDYKSKIEHLNKCSYIGQLRYYLISDIDLKIQTANAALENISKLLEVLKRPKCLWFLKFMLIF